MRNEHPLRRRDFLKCSAACAAGSTALYQSLSLAAAEFGGHPLAPKPTHYEAKAKQLLFIFLTGGFSHVDTFDPKPKLAADQGKGVSAVHLRGVDNLPLMGSPFRFSRYGESGLWMSELFPHLGTVADELCVVRSLHTDIVEHFQSVMAMHTGSATVPLPSIGAWLSFGLGTLNPNLPSYVVLAEHLTYAGSQVWDSNFLPPVHQGVRIVPGDKPIPDLDSPARSFRLRELERIMLDDANKLHAEARPEDLNLRASNHSFDVARGMMRTAPEIFDVSRETPATLGAYGVESNDRTSFGWQCLIARRLIESGVRTVELIDTGSSNNWDSHGNMQDHRPKAKRVDKPLATLLRDLRERGLLDETLVVICTEFGRTPWTDNATSKGRNHYARAFSSLLAGAGVKGGNVLRRDRLADRDRHEPRLSVRRRASPGLRGPNILGVRMIRRRFRVAPLQFPPPEIKRRFGHTFPGTERPNRQPARCQLPNPTPPRPLQIPIPSPTHAIDSRHVLQITTP